MSARLPLLLVTASLLFGATNAAVAKRLPGAPTILAANAEWATPTPPTRGTIAGVREAGEGADLESKARDIVQRHGVELGLGEESELVLKGVRHGIALDVVRLRQVVAGLPVLRGEIAVTFNRQGEAVYIANGLRPIVGDPGALAALGDEAVVSRRAARAIALDRLEVEGALAHESARRAIFPGAEGARSVWAIRLEPAVRPSGDWEALVDAATGELLRLENLAFYFDGSGHAFEPDPLSSAGATYGGLYVDSSDTDVQVLVDEIFDVALRDVTLDTVPNPDVYTLIGPWTSCVGELESPATACVTDQDGDFRPVTPSRASQAFEEMHVYHHIDTYMRYVNLDLGVIVRPTVVPPPPVPAQSVRFDPHGLGGADNSHYLSGSQTVAFGDGGVDDAEDADVVIHELGHGLHDWLTLGAGGLSQVEGLSEGLGDYLATSYSRQYPNQWLPSAPQFNWVFSWDGHNPFWSGRVTNHNDTQLYPDDLVGQVHADGQFWASCNIDIAERVGYDVHDRAVLEGIASTGPTTNQAAAAEAAMVAADALAYDELTQARMLLVYNSNYGTHGCNYGVTVPAWFVFGDEFEGGDTSGWDLTVE